MLPGILPQCFVMCKACGDAWGFLLAQLPWAGALSHRLVYWFPTSSNVCMKLDDLMCAAFKCRGWKTKPVERSVCHAGKCSKHFLEVSQKIAFSTNKGTYKSSAELGSESSCKNRGCGLWWMLEPLQGRWPVPLQLCLSQTTDNASSSNQSSANIWKPRFQVVRLKGYKRKQEVLRTPGIDKSREFGTAWWEAEFCGQTRVKGMRAASGGCLETKQLLGWMLGVLEWFGSEEKSGAQVSKQPESKVMLPWKWSPMLCLCFQDFSTHPHSCCLWVSPAGPGV